MDQFVLSTCEYELSIIWICRRIIFVCTEMLDAIRCFCSCAGMELWVLDSMTCLHLASGSPWVHRQTPTYTLSSASSIPAVDFHGWDILLYLLSIFAFFV
uniref:Uncharacterized protein n=1 Tax=Arundo donax TaxID=35708 RepID=A0A0A9D1Y0_ARUDO